MGDVGFEPNARHRQRHGAAAGCCILAMAAEHQDKELAQQNDCRVHACMHVWALTSSAEKLTASDSSGLVTHVFLHCACTPHSALISRETKVSLIEIHTRLTWVLALARCCYSSSGSSKESLDACARRAFFLCDLRSSAISLPRLCQSQSRHESEHNRGLTGTYTST